MESSFRSPMVRLPSFLFPCSGVFEKGTQEAIRWANQLLRGPPFAGDIFGQLAPGLLERIFQGQPSGFLRWKMTRRVGESWITCSLIGWLRMPTRLPSGLRPKLDDQKTHAMKQLTARWSLMDPVSTAEWLNQFPPSAKLDPVVGEFVICISARSGRCGDGLNILDECKKQSDAKALGMDRSDPKRRHGDKRTAISSISDTGFQTKGYSVAASRISGLLTNGLDDCHDGQKQSNHNKTLQPPREKRLHWLNQRSHSGYGIIDILVVIVRDPVNILGFHWFPPQFQPYWPPWSEASFHLNGHCLSISNRVVTFPLLS